MTEPTEGPAFDYARVEQLALYLRKQVEEAQTKKRGGPIVMTQGHALGVAKFLDDLVKREVR
jgi:NOL1/NOP2/fmu family ribosome biogenesis protein